MNLNARVPLLACPTVLRKHPNPDKKEQKEEPQHHISQEEWQPVMKRESTVYTPTHSLSDKPTVAPNKRSGIEATT
ncbi:hypothetical protein [Gimesia sp.]|uniref:hypothetical protein n=1 Tax=Gimesia sp. TaxID=2024833 RepID=UPI0025C4EB5F|nr:hypothetical protein [Gimesia sp.]|tara:strand:- start:5986 stop:6213 length:228 start_codon:yes stop_codon:yes gene_type:complete